MARENEKQQEEQQRTTTRHQRVAKATRRDQVPAEKRIESGQ